MTLGIIVFVFNLAEAKDPVILTIRLSAGKYDLK
jgi:hypothetical protein